MKRMNNKGFTLIELLVTLGISSIVIIVIFSFFINNVKTFNILENEMELQHQEQFTLDFITERLMQCSNITKVKDKDNNDVTNNSDRVSIKKLVLNGIEPDGEEGGYIFQLNYNYDRKSYDLKYGLLSENNYVNMEIANYIKEIEVEPIPANSAYANAQGIMIHIYVEKDGRNDEISTQITFRNK